MQRLHQFYTRLVLWSSFHRQLCARSAQYTWNSDANVAFTFALAVFAIQVTYLPISFHAVLMAVYALWPKYGYPVSGNHRNGKALLSVFQSIHRPRSVLICVIYFDNLTEELISLSSGRSKQPDLLITSKYVTCTCLYENYKEKWVKFYESTRPLLSVRLLWRSIYDIKHVLVSDLSQRLSL